MQDKDRYNLMEITKFLEKKFSHKFPNSKSEDQIMFPRGDLYEECDNIIIDRTMLFLLSMIINIESRLLR